MWWNDSYMPEYLLNNHEAYIGDKYIDAISEFVMNFGYVCAGAFVFAVLTYYYTAGTAMIPNFTYTKVGHEDFFNYSTRMKNEKVALVKDFQGSGKPQNPKITFHSHFVRFDWKKLHLRKRLLCWLSRFDQVRRGRLLGHCFCGE